MAMMLWSREGNRGPTAGFMTDITCGLSALETRDSIGHNGT